MADDSISWHKLSFSSLSASSLPPWLCSTPNQSTLEQCEILLSRLQQHLREGTLLHAERLSLEAQVSRLVLWEAVTRDYFATTASSSSSSSYASSSSSSATTALLALGATSLPFTSLQRFLILDRPFQLAIAQDGRTRILQELSGDMMQSREYVLGVTLWENKEEDRKVVAAEEMHSRGAYVVKQIGKTGRRNTASTSRWIDELRKEFVIMAALKGFEHPNVMEFLAYFENQSNIFAVLPRGEMSMYDFASMKYKVGANVVTDLLVQMVAPIVFLGNLGIVHRDIKLDNYVLFDMGQGRLVVKLIDFGWACRLRMNEQKTGWKMLEGKEAGTVCYMAPEVVARQPYDALKAEVWSLGVSFVQLIFYGRIPFTIASVADRVFHYVFRHGGAALLRNWYQNYPVMQHKQEITTIIDSMLVVSTAHRNEPRHVLNSLAALIQ